MAGSACTRRSHCLNEREAVAEELRRVRDGVRDRALLTRESAATLPEPLPVRVPEAVPPMREPPVAPAPACPDNAALNQLWRVIPTLSPLRARLARFLAGLLGFESQGQQSFNARQVQFDNELLEFLGARLQQIHDQYDSVLGIHRRHMAEIDERHLILQEELVAHVHDLVRRIDLVLGEGERGRLSLEVTLRDLRGRLVRLEERAARG